MNEDVIADLKQFITATISQQSAELRRELQKDLQHLEQRLEQKIDQKIDNLSAFIAQAIDAANDTTDTQLKDHESRITWLEHHPQLTI
jgi:ABC-type uncharacterized transport system ATPase component